MFPEAAAADVCVRFTLTHFGEPTPWTPEEIQVFVAKVRKEMDAPGMHAYFCKAKSMGSEAVGGVAMFR